MTGTRGFSYILRLGLAAIAAVALLALALTAAANSDAAKRAGGGKTYAMTSKYQKKKHRSVIVAVKKPTKNFKYRSSFHAHDAIGVGGFTGWGSDEAVARVGKVKICEINGTKKDCKQGKGRLTFDWLQKTKCKVKKKGKKKKVSLYARTIFEIDPSAKLPDGRAAAIQFAYPGEKPECPKF